VHWSPELHFTLQLSPHATSHAETLVQLAAHPVAPAAHWREQLAPPVHPHPVLVQAHVAPVHVGMVGVEPLHATAVEPTEPSSKNVERRSRDQGKAFIREPPGVRWGGRVPGLQENSPIARWRRAAERR